MKQYRNRNEIQGLTEAMVNQRVQNGRVNRYTGVKTRSVGEIVVHNVINLFNVANILLALLVILVGSIKNALFMGVVISNSLMGIIQEIKAKRETDKLSLLVAKKARAVRSGQETEIDVQDIVIDDILYLCAGDQVPVDGTVVCGECEVNEALLTGEAEPRLVNGGCNLLSGSFLVAGECWMQVTAIRGDAYAARITDRAKVFKKPNSEIQRTLNIILKIALCVIPVLGGALFLKQFFAGEGTLGEYVVSTVAAVIGMIPSGLVLLSTLVLCVGVLRLARKRILVQEYACIETLARVDVLCLDKTGTITQGTMRCMELIPLGMSEEKARQMVADFAYLSDDDNATLQAIRVAYPDGSGTKTGQIPFSSRRKFSAVEYEGGSLYLGAGEILCPEDGDKWKDYYAQGKRVLVLCHSPKPLTGYDLTEIPAPVATLILEDVIRDTAPDTLAAFRRDGVEIKVISGDQADAVAAVAQRAGLESKGCVDLAGGRENLEELVEDHTVFGRVSPEDKFELIRALKKNHTVAMVGDGVNDVLALREADCSVAMAAGSEAARNVSQIVLLDSDFAGMVDVVAEGRRAINNVERSSALYLGKTVYTALLTLILIFAADFYPFQPVQMTLISVFTIGVPSVILGLEPNRDRIRGRFIENVARKALPAAILLLANILTAILLGNVLGYPDALRSTMTVFAAGGAGLTILFYTAMPMNWLRGGLTLAMGLGFYGCAILLRDFLSLTPLGLAEMVILGVMLALSVGVFPLLSRIATLKIQKRS